MLSVQYSFRDPSKAREFGYLHPSLQKLFYLCVHILNCKGYDVEVTSMVRNKYAIPGESGVHSTGRAIDFIPVQQKGGPAISLRLMKNMEAALNSLFERADGKATLLWHRQGSGGFHHHLQVASTGDYKDLEGKVPNHDA